MAKLIVTGFRAYSPLTRMLGNPSETVAEAIGARFGNAVDVHCLTADATCLEAVKRMANTDASGLIMLGANLQFSGVRLELEGAVLESLLSVGRIRSSAAARLEPFARSVGADVGSAPMRPFIYWCLRSYAAALAWTEPRGTPCIFLHLGTVGFKASSQVEIVSQFVDRFSREF